MECRTISREQCLMLNRLVEEILRTNTKAHIFYDKKSLQQTDDAGRQVTTHWDAHVER